MSLQQEQTRERATPDGLGSLFFVGNATLVLRLAGVTILTDPNFVLRGTEIPLGYGLTTTRLTDPAMGIEQLPELDAVLLSHFHADHFDEIAEQRLARDVPIVTTPQAARILEDKGFGETRPLETWATYEIDGDDGRVRITSLPGKHAPGVLEVALPDVMGSLIEVWSGSPAGAARAGVAGASGSSAAPDLRLYISGDTIIHEDLRQIPQRAGEIDLALLHLGGTRVMGMTVTMDAEQGMELLGILRPDRAAAIHYDDYEAFKSPIEDFVAAVEAAGLTDRVDVLRRGETRQLG
jgi:L-ascorbate metabolism protein UlaG (beta-lactamase superfamily)